MVVRKKKVHRLSVSFCMIWCLCIVALILGGCQPLRKKFTRKKKEDSEKNGQMIPVLEPIVYPKKEYSVEQDYSQHYSLWRIWEKDLLQSIENDDSDKRQSYLLDKALTELEEMRLLLNPEQQAGLGEVLNGLRAVQAEYEKPAAMRNKFSVKKRLSTGAGKIRNHYSPRQVFPAQP